MARGLKFRISIVQRSYYPCSENKGADRLRGYREAGLRLCFRICKKAGFLITRLIFKHEGIIASPPELILFVSLRHTMFKHS